MSQSKLIDSETYKRVQIELNDQINLELLGYLIQLPNWQGKIHYHPFWELIYIMKGGGTLVYGDKEYGFDQGSAWLLEPGVKHKFTNTVKQRVEHLYIGFSFSISESINNELLNNGPDISPLPGGQIVVEELKGISEYLRQYNKEHSLYLKREQVLVTLAKMISIISSPTQEAIGEDDTRNLILAEKTKRYLENNLQRTITVKEVANLFYLSPHYFGELFKSSTGMTLKEYHNALRMTKAARLIEQNELNYSEIAQSLGFNSLHYFSRKFKEFYSVSPSQYQKDKLF